MKTPNEPRFRELVRRCFAAKTSNSIGKNMRLVAQIEEFVSKDKLADALLGQIFAIKNNGVDLRGTERNGYPLNFLSVLLKSSVDSSHREMVETMLEWPEIYNGDVELQNDFMDILQATGEDISGHAGRKFRDRASQNG